MATVRYSSDFRQRTTDVIHNMRRAEMQKFTPISDIRIAETDPRAWKCAFGDMVHLAKQCPRNWFSSKENFRIRTRQHVALDLLDGERTVLTDVILSVRPAIAGTHFVFPQCADYRPEMYYNTYEELVAEWPEVTGWKETEIEMRNTNLKWDKIKDDVLKFFQSFPSINAAIKHTPAMMMYLNQSDVERLESKSERSRPQDTAPAVDTSSLVQAAVAHRLGV